MKAGLVRGEFRIRPRYLTRCLPLGHSVWFLSGQPTCLQQRPNGHYFMERHEAAVPYSSYGCIEVRDCEGTTVACFGWRRTLSTRVVAGGTWVHPSLRRRRIAAGMWQYMLENEKPVEVNVTAITDGGAALVRSMHRLFPEIDWQAVDDRPGKGNAA